MLAMTPSDLLGFVRMHLDRGVAPDGTRVLSAASVQAMQTREVDLPRLAGMGDAWGLGWELFDAPQGTVVAHDGGGAVCAEFGGELEACFERLEAHSVPCAGALLHHNKNSAHINLTSNFSFSTIFAATSAGEPVSISVFFCFSGR